jgi:hypothetical protein
MDSQQPTRAHRPARGNGAVVKPESDRLNRMDATLNAILQRLDTALPEIHQTLDVQFKRIAAIQAELDQLKHRAK